MKIGNLDVTGIFVGDTEVYKAYLGDVIVYEKNVSVDAVKFTANAESTIGLAKLSTNQTLEYSTNKTTWTSMDTSTTINLASGDTVYVRGQLSGNNSSTDYTQFTMTGSIAASGSANYLWNKNNPKSTTLSYEYCGAHMFENCTALTTPPELPATTLTKSCYFYMFGECTGLTTATELPATTLASNCYSMMFNGCTSLTTAPELPATTLGNNCYQNMFKNCTSLTTAPELPATTLASNCYSMMFYRCTSLTTAPALPATTLVSSCYQAMFNGCTSLNYIKCLATTHASSYTSNWLTDVSSTGTFVKNPLMSSWTTGTSGIPTGWTVIDEPFMLKANTASTVGLASLASNQTLEYSTDGTTWTSMDTNTVINLESGDTVYVRGQLSGNNSSTDYTQFKMTGSIAASGSANYLWNKNNPKSTTLSYTNCGFNMFRNCTALTTPPALPATNLIQNCYYSMFFGCTSLTTAPELPATTLAQSCYRQMFYGCTSLTTAPEIPATTVSNLCCRQMFAGCTSLTNAPSELPATTLVDSCYSEMFAECNITTAPELPATTLTSNCYNKMFYNCQSLNYIKCLATDISATDCTANWVYNVSATGTFVKNSAMSSWTTGDSGIPSNWTVQNA